MNLQETSQLLSESLLDPDVFVQAAEVMNSDKWQFSCCTIMYVCRTAKQQDLHVEFFKHLFNIGDVCDDNYTFTSPAFWKGASEEELQPIRVLCLLFASHAARDHNRSVRTRLAAQKRKLTKVTQ
jgi:hypothetical protein